MFYLIKEIVLINVDAFIENNNNCIQDKTFKLF